MQVRNQSLSFGAQCLYTKRLGKDISTLTPNIRLIEETHSDTIIPALKNYYAEALIKNKLMLMKKTKEVRVIASWIKLTKSLKKGEQSVNNQELIKKTCKEIGNKIKKMSAELFALINSNIPEQSKKRRAYVLSSNIDCLKKIASDLSNYKR